MRARTIREGSVGLLILLGIGILGTLVLWLRGVKLGDRTYEAVVDFNDTVGLQIGSPVNYRGVAVGKVRAIDAGTNSVAVTIRIERSSLVIPKEVLVEANESGFIGEASIDITPLAEISTEQLSAKPIDSDCNSDLIVCDGDRIPGQLGTSFAALLRASVTLSNLFSDPAFIGDIRAIAKNTSTAAAGATSLTEEVQALVTTAQDELGPLSDSAQSTLGSLGEAADQLSLTANQVNELIAANRNTLVATLDNLNTTSTNVRNLSSALSPTFTDEAFLKNLETLAANAAQTSTNLNDLTNSINSPANLLLLQQTLESARATFQNAQKITADLDQLTGDPEFRRNVERLVNGLSKLVSSTQQLQQQIQVAQILEPALRQPVKPSRPQSFETAKDLEKLADQ